MAIVEKEVGSLPIIREAYDNNKDYYESNLVQFENCTYYCRVPGPIRGILPTNQIFWGLFAGTPVVQELGDSEQYVISQKAISDAFENLNVDADCAALRDFSISDNIGNDIIRVENGEIQTKGFDSRNLKVFESENDFAISDQKGKSILRIVNGEIETRNFDSSLLKVVEGSDADFSVSDIEGNEILRISDGNIMTGNFDSRTLRDLLETIAFEVAGLKEDSVNIASKKLKGKKIVVIGDSISEGVQTTKTYWQYIRERTNCEISNHSVPGSGFCSNTHGNYDRDRFVTRVTTENLSGANLVLVFGGINDFANTAKAIGPCFNEIAIAPTTYRGAKRLVPTTDTDTFDGALHEFIQAVKSIDKNVPILFITPLNNGAYPNPGSTVRPMMDECNSNGDYITDFVETVQRICRFYSIPVLDLNAVSNIDLLHSNSDNYWSVDQLHPNAKGHLRMSYIIENFIINHISL